MSFFRAFLLISLFFGVTHAETELDLQAVGLFKDLGQDEFYGAVYMNSAPNSESINNHEIVKRLEYRIIKSKITNSSFNRSLAQAISINNQRADLERNQEAIIEFTKALKWDLVQGDRLTIESSRNVVKYSFNGDVIFSTKNLELFSIIANTWFGSRPISVAFKRELSSLDTNTHSVGFNNLEPKKERINFVQKKLIEIQKAQKLRALALKRAEEKKQAEEKKREEQARAEREAKRREQEQARLKSDKAAFTRALIGFKTDLRDCERVNQLTVTSKTIERYEEGFRTHQNSEDVRDFVKRYPSHEETIKYNELLADSIKCLNSLRGYATKNFNAKRSIEGNINITDATIQQGIVFVIDDKKSPKSTTTLSFGNSRFSDKFVFVKPGDTLTVRNRDRSTTHFIALDLEDNVLFDFGLQAPSRSFDREINWRANTVIKIADKNSLNSFSYIVNIPSNQYQILTLNNDKSFFQLNNVSARIEQVHLLTLGKTSQLIEIPIDNITNNKAPVFRGSGVIAELSIKQ